MKLLVFVLNNTLKLNELLLALSNSGLNGATILKSVGMARSIFEYGKDKDKDKETNNVIISTLKVLLSKKEPENRTIFTVVDDEGEKIFCDVVERVIGSLTKENTGIMFTIPILSVRGFSVKKNNL